MSAIIGIYYSDERPVQCTDLDRMVDLVAPWPADDRGVWCSGSVGLGHRMFRNTPESFHERFPLTAPDGRLTLTADARIDNRDELIPQLAHDGRPRAEITDSDLILLAYQKWGEKCPDRLIGDFAFAIWDSSERKVFCARDAMGVRPFFYSHSGNTFVFGSSVEALLAAPGVPRDLNEMRVAHYFDGCLDDQTATFYRGILRLPGGHALAVDRAGCRVRTWWELDEGREIQMHSDEEYAEAFLSRFSEAVRSRLRSAFPVASMLSGGLDSSSVACVARGILQTENRAPLHTYSSVFPERGERFPSIDERKFQNAVTDRGGLLHHPIESDHLNPLHEGLWLHAEPNFSFNSYLDKAVFSAARGHGVRTVLTGYDGDTVVCHGTGLFNHLLCRGRFVRLLRESMLFSRAIRTPAWRVLWYHALRPSIPEWILARLHHRTQPGLMSRSLLTDDFRLRLDLDSPSVDAVAKDSASRSFRALHKEGILSGAMRGLSDVITPLAYDAAIEVAHPFFDRRVIEFCLAIPAEQKLRDGQTRSILRRAMSEVLPSEIRLRMSKGNLSSNFFMNVASRTNSTVIDVVSNPSQGLLDFVDAVKLRESWARFKADPIGSGWDGMNVFLAVILDLWLGNQMRGGMERK